MAPKVIHVYTLGASHFVILSLLSSPVAFAIFNYHHSPICLATHYIISVLGGHSYEEICSHKHVKIFIN